MDEEDDDFYDPVDSVPTSQAPNEATKTAAMDVKTGTVEDGEEEELEEEEEEDSDVNFLHCLPCMRLDKLTP